MNLRNTFITLGIVLAVLALGIAYAAMNSQTLNVVGNVATTTDDSNLRVYFVDDDGYPKWSANAIDYSDLEVSAEILDDHNAKFSVSGLNAEGQVFCAYYKIECSSQTDIAAKVRPDLEDALSSEWFDITYEWNGDIMCEDDNGIYGVLRDGDDAIVGLYIRLKKTPITDEELEEARGEFYVRLNAEPIRNDPTLWEDDLAGGEG